MNNVTRFRDTLNFELPEDRLPFIEESVWWLDTIDRWKKEGLPDLPYDGINMEEAGIIRDYFDLDPMRQVWFKTIDPNFQIHSLVGEEGLEDGPVSDMDSYQKIRSELYNDNPFAHDPVEEWGERQKKGELVFWISIVGFFWFPRVLFGIENHIYSFYDHPDVMHAINKDLVEYYKIQLNKLCKVAPPLFMHFAEDLSYNHGSMISKELFDEFMAPYYREILPVIFDNNIIPFVDTDGLIDELVPWYMELGIKGFSPLEHQSGVDIVKLRQTYPDIQLMGGFDKMVMDKGEEAVRKEFERILPVMRQGGYIPSVDHQTPPGISLEDYRQYLGILKEYCKQAVE